MTTRRRREVLLVAGPQGSGKTYLANQLTRRSSDYVIAPGVVTRSVRNQQDGNDAQVTSDEYQSMRAAGMLCLEATVGKHHYGYLEKNIDALLSEGKRVIVLLLYPEDVLRAKTLWPDALSVYLRPGDWDLLARRLTEGRDCGPQEVAELVKDGRRIVAALDGLDWGLRIDIVDGVEQGDVVCEWLEARG